MKDRFEQYQRVYAMLEDEESRDIYLNRLNWLISGNQKYIDTIVKAYLPWAPINEGKTIQDLKNSVPEDRKIVFYGAGTLGKGVLTSWGADERIIGFCSQTEQKQKDGYCGYPVMSPQELLAKKDLSVVISTVRAAEEIKQILKDGGYPDEQIYSLTEYFKYEDPEQYFKPDFIKFGSDEVFVDVGCCNLNSSLELRRHCKNIKKIYAFEPDPDCYEVCLERKFRHGFEEVELLPAGVWSKRSVLCFEQRNDGGSSVCEDGNITVAVVPIDEAIDPLDKVTMIKMDIEGAELEGLKGAGKTIRRDKPKLAICIYHKPEDMTEIPLYIKELVPEYKLYVRHHSNDSSETVLYAIMPEPHSAF